MSLLLVMSNDHGKKSNPICHDTQPLLLLLPSIVPTGAVILFVVFVTMFLSVKFRELAMHGHVGLLTKINSSVTDKLPLNALCHFIYDYQFFRTFRVRRLTFIFVDLYSKFSGRRHEPSSLPPPPPPPGNSRLRVALAPHFKICSAGPVNSWIIVTQCVQSLGR